MKKTREQINLEVRLRYNYFRSLGYSGVESRKLSKKKTYTDFDQVTEQAYTYINSKKKKTTKKTKQKLNTKDTKTVVIKEVSIDDIIKKKEHNTGVRKINNYVKQFRNKFKNDTTLTKYGALISDKRFKDDTIAIVKFIQDDNNLTETQAYYFLWLMYNNNMNYNDVKRQIAVDPNFEIYKKKGSTI